MRLSFLDFIKYVTLYYYVQFSIYYATVADSAHYTLYIKILLVVTCALLCYKVFKLYLLAILEAQNKT